MRLRRAPEHDTSSRASRARRPCRLLVFEEGRVTPFGPHELSACPRLHRPPLNVPAVASCHRRHLDEHRDRGDALRTHSTKCTSAGALPQTPGRVAASLGTAPARSVAVYAALLAAAPPAPYDPGTRRHPVKAAPSAGATGAAPGTPCPQRGSLDGDPPARVPCRVVSLAGLAAPTRRPGLGTRTKAGNVPWMPRSAVSKSGRRERGSRTRSMARRVSAVCADRTPRAYVPGAGATSSGP